MRVLASRINNIRENPIIYQDGEKIRLRFINGSAMTPQVTFQEEDINVFIQSIIMPLKVKTVS